ncbi:holin [Streptomyces scabiei]|uniref:holin n=1 Tax=Streptomyces scabiei TaxID=1930 RepID=UPI001B30C7C4|nr:MULTISPECIES: holin [Streptomyces]MDX2749638.1 holin [Streptomyces scabiei]MDX3146494.1 holin [Streptomyces scabiei]MDX3196900.1 holin [Streptomyces scabiei]QTU45953.1 holin [Streptomyces sp. LBUM 1482]
MGRRTGWRVCSVPGCPEFTQAGRCDEHRREAEAKRGTARQRGYGRQHETEFRPGVLAKHPTCVCTDTTHGHAAPCRKPSKHADHWPLDRRELVARGLDPNDPVHGRGLCGPCHSSETAQHQPGGWHQ